MSSPEDSHYHQLGESLTRLREQEVLTDAILISGDTRIPVHRTVLSAASKYFREKFTSSLKESALNEVEIKLVDGETLLEIVNFCYTGILKPSDEDMAFRVFKVADYLGIPNATAICYTYLSNNMKLTRCLEVFCFAIRHNLQVLKEDAFRIIAKNFNEVRHYERFKLMSADEMQQILQSEELNVKSEKDVFDALMDWCNYDKDSRESDLSSLVDLLSLPSLPPAVTRRLLLDKSINYGEVMQLIDQSDWEAVPLKRVPKPSFGNRLVGVHIKNEANGITLQWMCFSEKHDMWVNSGQLSVDCPEIRSVDRVLIGKSVLFLAGPDGDVFKYNLSSNLWEYGNVNRQKAGFACIDDNLYIVGGRRTKVTFADDKGYLGELNEDGFEIIHRKSPMSFDRINPSVCVVGKQLYVAGGSYGGVKYERVDVYNPSSNDWKQCSSLSVPSDKFTLAEFDGEMHCVTQEIGTYGMLTNRMNVYRFSRSDNTWTHLPNISEVINNPSICAFNGELIVCGKTGGMVMVIMALDPSESYWREIPSPKTANFQLLALPQDSVTRNKWLELLLASLSQASKG